MRRRIACLGVLLAGAVLLAGCAEDTVVNSQSAVTEISLSWWGNDARHEYTLAAVEQFEALHPEIRVSCSYSEWSGYEARSKVRMASGTEADVMQINFDWLGQYSPDGGGFYDLEELSDTLALDNFEPEQLDYGRRNGVLNAIPIAMNTETVYINQTIYESYGLDVPKTWDDLFEAAEVMRGDGVYPIAGAAKSVWLYLISYEEQHSGESFFSPEGELRFGIDEFEDMILMYRRMTEEKVLPQVEYFGRTEIDNGNYAGTVSWVSDAVNYFDKRGESGDTIVAAPYTAMEGQREGEGWYAKPATMYAVSKDTEHPKEAALLLDFLLNSEEMARLQGVEKGIPLSRSARACLEAEDKLNGLQYEAARKLDETEGMKEMEPVFESEAVSDAFVKACDEVIYGRKDAREAAEDFERTFAEESEKTPR